MPHEHLPQAPSPESGMLIPKEITNSEGEIVSTYNITGPGWYGVETGLTEIDSKETRWYHGGNDDEDVRYEKPFSLDVQSPEFANLAETYSEKIQKANAKECIHYLLDTVDSAVKSDIGNEFAHSISEIIRKGRGACASKALVAGLIVKETIEGANASIIMGQMGPVGKRVGYPYSHEWLRVQLGEYVALCDLMYHKYQIFRIEGEDVFEVDKNYDFSKNAVENLAIANIAKQTGAYVTESPQLKIVDQYDENDASKRVFIHPDVALATQVFGKTFTDIYIPKPGSFQTTDHNIVTVTDRSMPGKSTPMIKYPFYGIQRRT